MVSPSSLAGGRIELDGYNVLTTIEAGAFWRRPPEGPAMARLADMASMHGSYRKVEETRPALELIGLTLAGFGVSEALWLLDRPVSNSGRLKQVPEDPTCQRGWILAGGTVYDPDAGTGRSPMPSSPRPTAESSISAGRGAIWPGKRFSGTCPGPGSWTLVRSDSVSSYQVDFGTRGPCCKNAPWTRTINPTNWSAG